MDTITKKILLFSLLIILFFVNKKTSSIETFYVAEDSDLECPVLKEDIPTKYNWVKEYKAKDEKFNEKRFGKKMTKEKQHTELMNILIHLDKACEKMNVPMWLCHGTLLGAHRHKGFIPWDDDIDTQIREDDQKIVLSKEFNKLLPKDIEVQQGYINCEYNYYKNYCRLKGYNMNEKYNNSDFTICKNTKNGVYVDIWLVNSIKQGDKTYYDIKGGGSTNSLMTEQNYKNIFPLKKMEFEGRKFNVPNNTKFYLCKVYRNIKVIGKIKNNNYILDDKIKNMGFEYDKELWSGDLYLDKNDIIRMKT